MLELVLLEVLQEFGYQFLRGMSLLWKFSKIGRKLLIFVWISDMIVPLNQNYIQVVLFNLTKTWYGENGEYGEYGEIRTEVNFIF